MSRARKLALVSAADSHGDSATTGSRPHSGDAAGVLAGVLDALTGLTGAAHDGGPDAAVALASLAALRDLAGELERGELAFIEAARERGATWVQISAAIGASNRQTAQKRYADLSRRYSRPPVVDAPQAEIPAQAGQRAAADAASVPTLGGGDSATPDTGTPEPVQARPGPQRRNAAAGEPREQPVMAAERVVVRVWGEGRSETKMPRTLRVLVAGQAAGAIEHSGGKWVAQVSGLRASRPVTHETAAAALQAILRSSWARKLGARAASHVIWTDKAKRLAARPAAATGKTRQQGGNGPA